MLWLQRSGRSLVTLCCSKSIQIAIQAITLHALVSRPLLHPARERCTSAAALCTSALISAAQRDTSAPLGTGTRLAASVCNVWGRIDDSGMGRFLLVTTVADEPHGIAA